jgi:hypothetical protein
MGRYRFSPSMHIQYLGLGLVSALRRPRRCSYDSGVSDNVLLFSVRLANSTSFELPPCQVSLAANA